MKCRGDGGPDIDGGMVLVPRRRLDELLAIAESLSAIAPPKRSAP